MPIPPAVDIVTARLDPPPAVVCASWFQLSAEEQARTSRFRFERDRRRFSVARGGYELGSRIAFGISVGYFGATQTTSGRYSSIRPVGLSVPNIGLTDERTTLNGLLAGVWGGISFFERFPLRARVHAGFVVGGGEDVAF